jgi:hypothetical protein
VNAKKFKIIVENLPKSSQNIVLTLETTTSIDNGIPHLVEIKHEVFLNYVGLQSSFIDLCNSINEDGMPPNSLCPSKSLLQTSNSVFVSTNSPYSIRNIPFVGKPFVLSVVDYLKGNVVYHTC